MEHLEGFLREMNQVTFKECLPCEKFVLNKMAMNMKNSKGVQCKECSGTLLDHKASSVSEEDILAYLSHMEGKDGGNEILEREGSLGAVFVGGRGASLRDFVTKLRRRRRCNG